MTTKHTPGPWTIKEQGDADEYCALAPGNRWVIAFRMNGEQHRQEQYANAVLIAAAPELLERLKIAVEYLSHAEGVTHQHLAMFHQTIANAGG